MSIRMVLMTDAELKALVTVARAVDALDRIPGPAPRSSATLRRSIEALDDAVRWDRAGRVFFGITPACARAIEIALTRTEAMWDDGCRGTRHVQWFLRRLRSTS